MNRIITRAPNNIDCHDSYTCRTVAVSYHHIISYRSPQTAEPSQSWNGQA